MNFVLKASDLQAIRHYQIVIGLREERNLFPSNAPIRRMSSASRWNPHGPAYERRRFRKRS